MQLQVLQRRAGPAPRPRSCCTFGWAPLAAAAKAVGMPAARTRGCPTRSTAGGVLSATGPCLQHTGRPTAMLEEPRLALLEAVCLPPDSWAGRADAAPGRQEQTADGARRRRQWSWSSAGAGGQLSSVLHGGLQMQTPAASSAAGRLVAGMCPHRYAGSPCHRRRPGRRGRMRSGGLHRQRGSGRWRRGC
jgi:hypothetical protein